MISWGVMRDRRVAVVFGRRLRQLREGARLSQSALAVRAQVSEPYIGMLERGLREPSLTTIIKLARALGVSPGALVD
jgi:transcriptional regulator with XRE-family HTH domain